MDRNPSNCRFYKSPDHCSYFEESCTPTTGKCMRAYSPISDTIDLGYEALTHKNSYGASELTPEDLRISSKIDLTKTIPVIHIYRGYLSDDLNRLTTHQLKVSNINKKGVYTILAIYNKVSQKYYMPLSLQYMYLRKGYAMRVEFQYASILECTKPLALDVQKPVSILKLYGYTVGKTNGLPEHQRQSIIKFILDHRVLKGHEVLSLLQYFINLREKSDKNFDKAIDEWKKDLRFTANYIKNKLDKNIIPLNSDSVSMEQPEVNHNKKRLKKHKKKKPSKEFYKRTVY